MKVLVLYRPQSEHARLVEMFVHDLEHQYDNTRLDIIDVDSRDGIATASLYDIMDYPGILALTDDGQILKSWQGEQIPRLQDVAYYAQPGGF